MRNSINQSVRKFIQQTTIAGILWATPLQFFSQAHVPDETNTQSKSVNNKPSMNSIIRIKIGSSKFSATLEDNATATAFKALLPMTINMTELNGNEKYFNLSSNLPTNASNPSTIKKGDLMMYRANTVVLFYKTFSTSYSYTKLGHLDNPVGLDAALGSGSVTLTFESQ